MDINRRTLVGGIGALIAGLGITSVGASRTNLISDDEDVSPSEVSLSEAEAKDIATNEVPGTVQETELEGEEDGPVYEFEIETTDGTRKEVEVHANSGDVLEVETEEDDDDEDEDVSPSEVSLTEAEAKGIATDEVPGTVQETELEGEEDGPVYEFDIETTDGSHKEVEVHANSGDVLEVETEDDDENEDDDDADGDD